MATQQLPAALDHGEDHPSGVSWVSAKPLWGGVAIVAMWLAVLFVGIFGGDLVNNNGSSGTTSVIPTGVLVALLAVFGTFAVARRAFAVQPDDELRRELEDECHARERLAEEVSHLRAQIAGRSETPTAVRPTEQGRDTQDGA